MPRVPAAAAAARPAAARPFQELTIPSPTSPGLHVQGLPFLPPSLALPGSPRGRVSKGKGPRLFSCYFSSVWSPQQTTPDRHEGPTAPGLSNPILGKGDSALARPKLLSSLLLELDFIRKAMEGGQGVLRNDDCSWSLSIFYLSGKYLSKRSVAPVEPWHCLLDFPVRTYPFSPPCPTLSTEVLGGNAALTAFSGQWRGPGPPRWTCHSLHSYF